VIHSLSKTENEKKMKDDVAIAHLAHSILGEPEDNVERLKEFLAFGRTAKQGSPDVVVDPRIRSLALLSATAVVIDILPSFVVVDSNQEADETQKLSKEHRGKLKRLQQTLGFFDELLSVMSKTKLIRGPSTIINSGICAPRILDQKRLAHIVSVVISLACSTGGSEAAESLQTRIKSDLMNNTDNLEVTRLIVQSICREKNPDRLDKLVPIIRNMRFRIPSNSTPDLKKNNSKLDKNLVRDLALGRADYLDIPKLKKQEAAILADSVALFVRVLRASQSGTRYSFDTIRTCVEGISQHIASVNSDIGIELEKELFDMAKTMLTKKKEDSCEHSDGLLGAIALSSLLNISKGSKERQAMLADSIVSAAETLVPVALSKLTAAGGDDDCLTDLCKGAIAVASQWGSDRCMLSIARALVNSLCMRFSDRSKLIVDLIVHLASRSALVRSAIDPDGVLVDGNDETGSALERCEVSLFYQLQYLMGHRFAADPSLGNYLVGSLSKYCKLLARRDAKDAVEEKKLLDDEQYLQRKKKRLGL